MPKFRRKPPSEGKHSYLQYAGLGIQFTGIILVAAWCGHLADNHVANTHQYYTLLFSVIALVGVLFMLVKKLSSK